MAPKHVVVKKKVLKKVARREAAGAAPAAKPPVLARPRPRPSSYAPREGFGVSDFLILIAGVACAALIVLVFLPVDLSHVEGYPAPAAGPAGFRNLLQEAENKLIEGSGSVLFTEAEVNAYLHRRLKTSQRGPLSMISEVEGMFVDLQKDAATLYFVQRFFGYPLVVSTSWNYYLADRRYVRECTSSAIGHLRIKGILLRPLMMPFRQLVNSCKREASFFLDRQGIERVRLEEGALKLEVNRPSK